MAGCQLMTQSGHSERLRGGLPCSQTVLDFRSVPTHGQVLAPLPADYRPQRIPSAGIALRESAAEKAYGLNFHLSGDFFTAGFVEI
jgi:hypothetical protein